MSPEYPPFVPSQPENVVSTASKVPESNLIVIPNEMQQDLEAQRILEASNKFEEQRIYEQAAEAARQIISNPPVTEVTAPQAVQTSSADKNMGRSGLGVFEVPMPADPSKVSGWNG